jgi:hypothetical protein
MTFQRASRPEAAPPRPGLSLGLAASASLQLGGGGAVAAFTLGEGQSAAFVLRTLVPHAHPGRCPGDGEALTHLALIGAAFNLDRALAGRTDG